MESYLQDYDLRTKKVTIKLVWADLLSDTGSYMDQTFYIDSYSSTEQAVSFVLSTKLDILNVKIPCRDYIRNHCEWKFKSTQCGYSGGESECDKTLQRCRVLGNYSRYGGFPSIPFGKIYAG